AGDGDRTALRRRLGLGDGPVIGFLGNQRTWHGVADLLRAVLGLAGAPPPRLLILGSIEDRAALRLETLPPAEVARAVVRAPRGAGPGAPRAGGAAAARRAPGAGPGSGPARLRRCRVGRAARVSAARAVPVQPDEDVRGAGGRQAGRGPPPGTGRGGHRRGRS